MAGLTDTHSRAVLRSRLLLSAFSLALLYWYRIFLTAAPLPLADLPGHIAVVERLLDQLRHGRLFFYDPFWFTGWPVFEFYGFLPYLVTALLAVPLQLLSSEPCRLAVHVLIVAGCAALPWSLAYAVRPLIDEACETDAAPSGALFPLPELVIGTLSLWFLNHDDEAFGLGAAAPMQVGLYTQMFGWHLLLCHGGALYRLLRNGTRRTEVHLAVVTALLVLTHTLTAAFGFFVAGLALLRFSGARLAIARSHILGVALSAFWLVPCFAHSAAYTIDVMEPSANDLLGLLVRYPLTDSLRALTLTMSGHFIAFDPTGLFLGGLLLAALASRAVRACQLLSSFLLFGLISSAFFSSELIAASIPLPLHYYRFRASEVLLFIELLSVIPVVLVHQMARSAGGQRWLRVARSGILAACSLSILLNLLLPHFGQVMLERMDLRTRLAHDSEVLAFFDARPLKGRVLFEHFQDRDLFAPITPHYLPSRLARTGWETVNGLFVQSSLANRLLLGSAQRLGITVYGATPLTREVIGRSDAAEVAQLRALGVTHVVLTQRDSIERLTPFVIDPPVTIGPYNVLTIAPSPPTLVQCVQRPLVGYVDHAGTLPFKLFEVYWLSRLNLASALDLVALDPAAQPPTGLSTVIVNGTAPGGARTPLVGTSGAVPVLSVDFDPPFQFDHYRPRRMPHGDTQAAQQVSRYLDARLDLDALHRLGMEPDVPCGATERLQWDDDHQGFQIEGMHRGQMVRINYTYFPYWHADDGALFRGAAERMYYDPAASTASFTYTRNRSFSTWLGIGLSLAAAAVLAFGYGKHSKPGIKPPVSLHGE